MASRIDAFVPFNGRKSKNTSWDEYDFIINIQNNIFQSTTHKNLMTWNRFLGQMTYFLDYKESHRERVLLLVLASNISPVYIYILNIIHNPGNNDVSFFINICILLCVLLYHKLPIPSLTPSYLPISIQHHSIHCWVVGGGDGVCVVHRPPIQMFSVCVHT